MEVSYRLYGDQAVEVALHLNKQAELGEYDVNTKVCFNVKRVNGDLVVEVSFDI